MSKYAITGINDGLGPNGQVPVRREIDEWWSSKDPVDALQRSLFVLALRKIMSFSPSERTSYFAMAGIHGLPLKSWDNHKQQGFYCVHGTPLFPTWHRPYLALYEQVIYETMLQIIRDDLGNQQQLRDAARTWRLPFWDFAAKKPDWRDPDNIRKLGPNCPFAITQQFVELPSIFVSKSGPSKVENPLWRFQLPTGKTFGNYDISYYQYGECQSTCRHPSTADPRNRDYKAAWVEGKQQNWQKITGELRGSDVTPNTLPEDVYRLFSDNLSYDAFATDRWLKGDAPQNYTSLEGLHGNVHGLVGGDGHMGAVEVAAFDPIFWFHHNNIDRLTALYQALYPTRFVTESRMRTSRGTVVVNKTVPLAPFSKDTRGTPWTSADAEDQTKLFYTYPELKKWDPKHQVNGQFNQALFQKNIRIRIEQLYSTTGKATLELEQHARIAETHLAALNEDNIRVEQFSPAMFERALATVPITNAIVLSSMESAAPAAEATSVAEVASMTELPKPKPALVAGTESWKDNDYIVNVLYDRFANEGRPFSIRIFLGDVPDVNDFSFVDTPTQVGLVYNFSAGTQGRGIDEGGCQNCKDQKEAGELSTGQVILTDHLVQRITTHATERGVTLESLGREDVVAYLKANLHWRILNLQDDVIQKENMPALKVSVAMGKATHFLAADKFSKYEDYEILYEITEGRRAGAAPGDLQ